MNEEPETRTVHTIAGFNTDVTASFGTYLSAQMEKLPEPPAPRIVDKVPQPNYKMIEPDPKDVVLCVYGSTLDDFVAAWVVRQMAKKHNVPVEFVEWVGPMYGHTVGADGRNAFEIGVPAGTANGARSCVMFRRGPDVRAEDYPSALPFNKWGRTFPYGIKTMAPAGVQRVQYAASRLALAALAWDFFHEKRVGFDQRPRLIEHLADSLSGAAPKFNDTPDVVACVDSYPRAFRTLDSLVEAVDDRKRRELVITGGQAIRRYIAKNAPTGVSE